MVEENVRVLGKGKLLINSKDETNLKNQRQILKRGGIHCTNSFLSHCSFLYL